MPQRILRGAERIHQAVTDGTISTVQLRQEQRNVYADVTEFLTDVATCSPTEAVFRKGRIILPPRTGKTIIAGEIIIGSGLTSVFVVPTRSLVDQTASMFRKQFPDTPVGVYYGDEKTPCTHGVIVTTYAMLQYRFKRDGNLPDAIESAALIFVDEAHRCMTDERRAMIRDLFNPFAVRIALTATPDYSKQRRLKDHFPELIHKITIHEAVELNLLAPLRVWVSEVDVGGSRVSIRAGDYDSDSLSNVMRQAPFMEAACHFRYDASNRDQGALVCCATKAQARNLCEYMRDNKPADAPDPVVILGETSADDRKKYLEQFDAGEIDTIINVHVLLQGWSAPRCKLLIDLAPSMSLVRATQKFFRPMTRWGKREANIYMFIPDHLPAAPILPMDLFLPDGEEGYEMGTVIGGARSVTEAGFRRHDMWMSSDIENVELKSRVSMLSHISDPDLDPSNTQQVRDVIETNPGFSADDLPILTTFRHMRFSHELFEGRGIQLLRLYGVRPNRNGYLKFVSEVVPEASGSLFLSYSETFAGTWEARHLTEQSCHDDLRYIESKMAEGLPEASEVYDWAIPALAGPYGRRPELNPEEAAMKNEADEALLDYWRDKVTPRQEMSIRLYYGLEANQKEHTLQSIGEFFNVTATRIRQARIRGMREIRNQISSLFDKIDPNYTNKHRCLKDGVRGLGRYDSDKARNHFFDTDLYHRNNTDMGAIDRLERWSRQHKSND